MLLRKVYPRPDWAQDGPVAWFATQSVPPVVPDGIAAPLAQVQTGGLPPLAAPRLALWPERWTGWGVPQFAELEAVPPRAPAWQALVDSGGLPPLSPPKLALWPYPWTWGIPWQAELDAIPTRAPAWQGLVAAGGYPTPKRTPEIPLWAQTWTVDYWIGYQAALNAASLLAAVRRPAFDQLAQSYRMPERTRPLALWFQSWVGPLGWLTTPLDLLWTKQADPTGTTWTKVSDPSGTTWTKVSDPSGTTWTKG